MRTPVVFIIFNRPEVTQRVFEAIHQAKPSTLLVIADGPRTHRSNDVERCAATRAVINQVDWKCELLKNYSDENLGCGKRISSGLDWVFDTVEKAIILEDDCLPHPTFFQFCEELLDLYHSDSRVMQVSGSNFNALKRRLCDSYSFSHYAHIWGWATWKRAWQYNDFHMKNWSQIKEKGLLNNVFSDKHVVDSWTKTFQHVADGKLDTWAIPWMLSCLMQNGLSIIPKTNLISNIGFGSEATHTTSGFSLPIEPMPFPLQHPKFVVRDTLMDDFIEDNAYDYHPRLSKRIKLRINKLLQK